MILTELWFVARFNSLDENNNLLHLIELQKMSSENNGTKIRDDSEKPRKEVFFKYNLGKMHIRTHVYNDTHIYT